MKQLNPALRVPGPAVATLRSPPPRNRFSLRTPATLLPTACLTLCVLALADAQALAQLAHHPFAVGANEGAVGHQNALGAWLLGQESRFYLKLTGAIRATRDGIGGAPGLIALSFAYGVFHAAGPGHGKAVITSYMVSNEVALRRGLLIAVLAALLQGAVAVALVGIAAVAFHATAGRMTAISRAIELASYLGIVALGLLLVWRKGRALWAATRSMREAGARPFAPASLAPLPFGAPATFGMTPAAASMRFDTAVALSRRGRFFSNDGTAAPAGVHDAGCACGHHHMPDPRVLAADRFDWRAAAIAIATAGARPCSGAILVLVFALAQGVFLAGVAATFAMAAGTALTTGALAAFAVMAKDLAMRLTAGAGSARTVIVGRLVEFGAAAGVLLFGLALLAGALAGVNLGA